jgi:quinol monooxygenase YgiN
MIKHTVRFTVDLTTHERKFEEFQGIAQAMIADTQKEPGALGYDLCLSSAHRRCRILVESPERTSGQHSLQKVAARQEF